MAFDIFRFMKQKICPFLLTIVAICSLCIVEANAFSLDNPTTSYDEFLTYSGIKVFISGRYVEFSDETGYPYIKNGTVMIPLQAIKDSFGVHAIWDFVKWDDTAQRYESLVISKHGYGVQLKDHEVQYTRYENQGNESTSRSIATETIIIDGNVENRNGITYVPLRPVLEGFGLTVRWEKETQTVHAEITDPASTFTCIDFKSIETAAIADLDIEKCDQFIYDGRNVSKDYINLLKNSDQYNVVVEGKTAKIFSYYYLGELNYLYEKVKALKHSLAGDTRVMLYRVSDEENEFFKSTYSLVPTQINLSPWHDSWRNYSSEPNPTRKSHFYQATCTEEYYNATVEEARKIVERVRNDTDNPKEQALRISKILHNEITYSYKVSEQGAYEALVLKESVCGGFASAFQLIMEKLGIPCVRVLGFVSWAKSPHAWNQVYIEGKWYIFDATRGIGMIPLESNEYGTTEGGTETYIDLNAGTVTEQPTDSKKYEDEKNLIMLTYKFD